MMLRLAAWWCGGLCAAGMAHAETPVQRLLEDKLLFNRVQEIAASVSGPVGVATVDLTSGRVWVFNGEAEFPAASTIKVAIMAELFRQAEQGTVRLDGRHTLEPRDAAGGSGWIAAKLASGPVTMTLRELIAAMMEASDNTATNRAIAIAGRERINAFLARRGMRATRLRRLMMDTAAAARGEENTASPLEMARLLEDLYRGRLGNAASTAEMRDILSRVRADVRKAVPDRIRVESKPGDLAGVHNEVAIVHLPNRPFCVAVYAAFLEGTENPVPEIAEAVFRYFAKLAVSNPYGNRVREPN